MKIPMNRIEYNLRDQNGVAAVEFALIAPAMLMLFVGLIMFSFVLSTYAALQQIAAEAARAGLPGVNATEQAQFANQYISGVLPNYSFLNPTSLVISTNSTSSTFNVTLTYDEGGSFFSTFGSQIVSTPMKITRAATVQLSSF